MRNLLVAGCIASLALVAPLSAQEAEPDAPADGRPEFELSLFDAVEMALRYNLQVRLNKLAPESTYENIDASRAPFDPTIIFDFPSAFGRNAQQGTSALAGGAVVSPSATASSTAPTGRSPGPAAATSPRTRSAASIPTSGRA